MWCARLHACTAESWQIPALLLTLQQNLRREQTAGILHSKLFSDCAERKEEANQERKDGERETEPIRMILLDCENIDSIYDSLEAIAGAKRSDIESFLDSIDIETLY